MSENLDPRSLRRPRPLGGSQALGIMGREPAEGGVEEAEPLGHDELGKDPRGDGDTADSDLPDAIEGTEGAAEPGAWEGRATPKVSSGWAALAGALIVALLVTAALAVNFFLDVRAGDVRAARDKAALAAAQDGIGKLINIDYAKVDVGLGELLKSATGDFAGQLGDQEGVFKKAVVQGRVRSKGEVLSSGIVSASDTEATVMLAATARVTNVEAKKGENRYYRFEVRMVKQGDRWLIGDLRFVP